MAEAKRTREQQSQLINYGLLFGSLVACLPFIWFSSGWISLVALLPFIFFVKARFESSDKKHLVLPIWLFGLFYSLLVCGWLVNADAKAWTQLGGLSLQYLVFILWLIMGLILSLGFLTLGILTRWSISRKMRFEKYLILLPFFWVACEYLRGWLFTIISYDRNAAIGPYFNFGALGYSLTSTKLLRFAQIGGLFGLSFLVVAVNAALVLMIMKKYRAAGWLLTPLLILLALAYLPQKAPQTINVATVQLASLDKDYYGGLSKIIPAGGNNQLLVMPEYSYFFDNGSLDQQHKITSKVFDGNQGTILYSRKGTALRGLQTNELVAAKPNGDIFNTQLKYFLVPTGEYIPWIIQQGLRATGQSNVMGYFNASIGIAKANHKEQVVKNGELNIGALVCSGVIAPDRYRELTSQGANVLTNSASLNEFARTPIYHQQSRQFARFIATANNRPFVQAARGGYSSILDHDGQVLYESHAPGLKYGQATVHTTNQKTIYSQLGEWVAWLSSAVTLLFASKYVVLTWSSRKLTNSVKSKHKLSKN